MSGPPCACGNPLGCCPCCALRQAYSLPDPRTVVGGVELAPCECSKARRSRPVVLSTDPSDSKLKVMCARCGAFIGVVPPGLAARVEGAFR